MSRKLLGDFGAPFGAGGLGVGVGAAKSYRVV